MSTPTNPTDPSYSTNPTYPTVPTVPPTAAQPGTPTPPPGETRGASRVVAILTIALGGAVVLGAIGSATFSTIAAASVRSEAQSIDATGVTELDVSVDGAALRIEFDEVAEATLEVTSGGGVGPWTLERDGDELNVASPRTFGPRWLFFGDVKATLTLPSEIQGAALDAVLDLSAGDLTVDGDFGNLDIRIGAGGLTVDGSAQTLLAELSAGAADIELADVREAQFSVSAGTVDARLTGSSPREVTVDVSAGSLDLRVPEGAYDVRSDVSAGEFNNELRTDAGARNVVDVTVSAGSATIAGTR
ncbi:MULTISPECIES: DUF4097 domain-containing protein [unclassified Microbacterium]|uniref:DUF4097 domain-containing protein n=1 Tax=unclassified Microbacterium TaxID=2609290 RepID=UPI00214B0013|nr:MULTISPECIES: DUF4097 domain-containing protein [unclassified Microbacterium]MCR2810879.1 DUF4097 domain-containing protein [Microbacterium sp. zg.B185]WIM19718.1 DUF4097 domain-containing protein [Microbacterium sp. zg-B185]